MVSPGVGGLFQHPGFHRKRGAQLSLGEGTPAGADQLQVTGGRPVGSDTQSVSTRRFSPSPLQEFVLIENDGADAVTGNFSGLQEGRRLRLMHPIFRSPMAEATATMWCFG